MVKDTRNNKSKGKGKVKGKSNSQVNGHPKEHPVQVDLNGVPIPKDISELEFYKRKARHFFDLKHSIWFTLKCFYNANKQKQLMSTTILRLAHNKYYPLSNTSIKNNLTKLLDIRAIHLKYTGAGRTKRKKLYDISELGKQLFEKYLNETQSKEIIKDN